MTSKYRMPDAEYQRLIREQGQRRADFFRANHARWIEAGSYVNKWRAKHEAGYEAPVINPTPNPVTPERQAEYERVMLWVDERLAAYYREPDGTQFYEYTIEYRYGVQVGCEWRPEPCRAIVVYCPPVAWMPPVRGVVVSLWHPYMLSEVA